MTTTDRRGNIVSSTDPPLQGGFNPGLAIKVACRVATTANIVLSGLQTIDGIALAANDRVLVWLETDATLNGLYNASTGNWTRTIDANSNALWADGMQVEVNAGTLYGRSVFRVQAADPINLGTSAITIVRTLNASLQVIAGALAVATLAPVAHQWVSSINAAGIPQLTRPTFSDVGASRTPVSDVNYAALTTDWFIAYTTLTAARTVTLPAASSMSVGQILNIQDDSGNASAANTISAAPTGADQINGSNTTQIVVNNAFGYGLFETDGVSKWFVPRNAFTGDVTGSGVSSAFGLTIAANAVTYAKFQQVAASSLVGNATGGLANATGITLGATLAFSGAALQTTAHTGDVTSPANSNALTVAANAVDNTKFRQGIARSFVGVTGNATANVADIQGAANQIPIVNNAGTALAFVTISGDLTNSTGAFTIANAAVTYAKMQNVAASRLLGNPTGAPAAPAEITLGATLAFSGTALQTAALTGDATAGANSFATVVGKVNGVSYGASPSTNTVPVVTGANTVTYETCPVAAGGTGDTGTAWTTFTPSLNSNTATFTVNSARYKQLGKTLWFSIDFTISGGAPATTITFNVPVNAQSGSACSGRETVTTGLGVSGSIAAAGAVVTCTNSNVSAFAVNERVMMSGVYETV